MNNDYVLERMGKLKEIWAEKLHPQLSQLSDLAQYPPLKKTYGEWKF